MKKQDITVIAVTLFSLFYLLNPTAGFLEFIPDNIPIIGNLDEAGAVFVILSALKYFGFEMPDIFKKAAKTDKNEKATVLISKRK